MSADDPFRCDEVAVTSDGGDGDGDGEGDGHGDGDVATAMDQK